MNTSSLALALALALAPLGASAQTPAAAPARAPTGGSRVVRVHAVVPIVGTVARPLPWIRSRSGLHYQPAETRRPLAPSVVRAVGGSPF